MVRNPCTSACGASVFSASVTSSGLVIDTIDVE
jgi:hypothetical protein